MSQGAARNVAVAADLAFFVYTLSATVTSPATPESVTARNHRFDAELESGAKLTAERERHGEIDPSKAVGIPEDSAVIARASSKLSVPTAVSCERLTLGGARQISLSDAPLTKSSALSAMRSPSSSSG
jgi:hypothetical protein